MCIRIILSVLLLAYSQQVFAASMRCGNKVVKTNDSREAVQKRCGKPDSQKSGYSTIKLNGLKSKQRVEQWTYYQGRGKHSKIVLFHKDRLVDVILGKKRK